MLAPDIKAEIQKAYSHFLNNSGFSPRSSQKHMIAAIAKQLTSNIPLNNVVAVEAGTGTGKTLAYLLAALPIAKQTGKSLVVSTATIALQEQLIFKDLPDVCEKAKLPLNYQLVKGRGRYMCQLKLENMLAGDLEAEQMQMYMQGDAMAMPESRLKLYDSMQQALTLVEWDGDRDNWPDAVIEDDWRPLTSDRYQCVGRACRYVQQCAFFNAREQMEDAQVLVVNHDLLLSDLSLGGGVILPEIENSIYVFDEAHHLGDKARKHFATRFRFGSTFASIKQQTDLLVRMSEELVFISGVKSLVGQLQEEISKFHDLLQPIPAMLQFSFDEAPVSDNSFGRDSYDLRFSQGELPDYLANAAGSLSISLSKLESRFSSLAELLSPSEESYKGKQADIRDSWYPIVGQWLARTENSAALWRNYSIQGEQRKNYARWMKNWEGTDFELYASPIVAGDMLYDQMWSRCAGAVLTSATLTALGSFDRLKTRAGLTEETPCLSLPSPFDYANKSILFIPKDAANPKDVQAHDDYMVEMVEKILDPNKGNLVLFSSGRQMDQVFDSLDSEWQKKILIQGSRSKQRLIERHKERIDDNEGSTIFGLASFAEGIDLPGDYCVHVMIAKIPFSVPNDPEEEAFAEWIEMNNGNSFRDLSLADASMRLMQAVGRLLRSEKDTGQVSIMDERLLSKFYGKQLVKALPPMRLVHSLGS